MYNSTHGVENQTQYKIKNMLKIPPELKSGERENLHCIWNTSCVTFTETEADAINVQGTSLKGASADTR